MSAHASAMQFGQESLLRIKEGRKAIRITPRSRWTLILTESSQRIKSPVCMYMITYELSRLPSVSRMAGHFPVTNSWQGDFVTTNHGIDVRIGHTCSNQNSGLRFILLLKSPL